MKDGIFSNFIFCLSLSSAIHFGQTHEPQAVKLMRSMPALGRKITWRGRDLKMPSRNTDRRWLTLEFLHMELIFLCSNSAEVCWGDGEADGRDR